MSTGGNGTFVQAISVRTCLLHYVREFMCKQTPASFCLGRKLTGAKYDAPSDGVGKGVHRARRLFGQRVIMQPYA